MTRAGTPSAYRSASAVSWIKTPPPVVYVGRFRSSVPTVPRILARGKLSTHEQEVKPMQYDNHGWGTVLGDGPGNLAAVRIKTDGTAAIWQRRSQGGYLLTNVLPDGRVLQATGRTRDETRKAMTAVRRA
jgi:hypothetical protein